MFLNSETTLGSLLKPAVVTSVVVAKSCETSAMIWLFAISWVTGQAARAVHFFGARSRHADLGGVCASKSKL
jgi:hypothetical protein